MNAFYKSAFVLILILISTAAAAADEEARTPAAPEDPWHELEAGLEFGTFQSPRAAESGDSIIRVLRIDPNWFELRLLNASAPGQNQRRTAKDWCRKNGLVAAINASMYQEDLRTSVSLMRTRTHVNNPRLSRDNAILAYDRRVANVPLVKIIDRQCEDFSEWKQKYGTLVQSIRMISCKRKNVWEQQPKKWSTAAIGIDDNGRVLFIHVRSRYSTHDLINILIDLPLDISQAMYVEGGAQAQLYVQSGDQEHELVGLYETGFKETVDLQYALQIPNVVGIVRRDESIREADEQ